MSDSWWRLTLHGVPDQGDALAAAVVAATGNGVEELAADVVCTTVDDETLAHLLRDTLTARFAGLQVDIARTAPVDWTTRWRDGIVTRRFGRLVLTPSWLPVTPAANEVVVTLDPESAFGSGEHGSTRGALALLERHLRPGDRILDLGSGSGILAISGAKLGARSAIGIEVDEQSNPIAEANARRNDVASRVTFLTGDADLLGPLSGPGEVICSNILRSVNTLLLPSILASLAPGGTIIFAGMEEPEAELFLPTLASHGLLPVDEVRDANWWSVAVRCS